MITSTPRENRSLGFLIWSDTNLPVQLQKKPKILKYGLKEERDCTICVAKTKAFVSFAVSAWAFAV